MIFESSKGQMRQCGHCHSQCIHQSLERIVHPKDFCFGQMEQKQEHSPQLKRMMMTIHLKTMNQISQQKVSQSELNQPSWFHIFAQHVIMMQKMRAIMKENLFKHGSIS